MFELLLDRAGRRRSPTTMPGFHAGRAPGNKPNVEEIIAVMRAAGDHAHGRRLRGVIVILWRAELRIQEALGLVRVDIDPRRGALLFRPGKGRRRREVGMDAWGVRTTTALTRAGARPAGSVPCCASSTAHRAVAHWSSASARADLRHTAAAAGVPRRFAPHQLRHAPRR